MKNFSFHKWRILIADDNEMNAFYTKIVLEKAGFEAETVNNGSDVLDYFQNQSFDALMLDYKMPKLNGIETARFIRKNFTPPKSDVPIILFTATKEKRNWTVVDLESIDEVVVKPFETEVLLDLVSRLILNSRQKSGEVLLSSEHQYVSDNKILRPGVDFEHMARICDNDNEFIKSMLTKFIQNTPGDFQLLYDLYKSEDWSKTEELAHKMKPSAKFIGAPALVELLGNIEETAVDQNKEGLIEDLIENGSLMVQHLCNVLKEEMEKLG
ncbi:MAG: response regulator [Cyclobacteriaceae bacterium]|nr:response regulator [Cyclobacteriaceae bacterium]